MSRASGSAGSDPMFHNGRPRPALVLVTSRGTQIRPPPEPETEPGLLSTFLEVMEQISAFHPRWYSIFVVLVGLVTLSWMMG